jgi:glycosyltransferase involved in cell wall biosynthesis
MRVTGAARALGITAERCREWENLPQDQLHEELPWRRVYVHPFRWTSLGLSLIEAMFLGMPVVVLAATEAPRAVPPAAGAISTDVAELHAAVGRFTRDREAARAAGQAAREAARAKYGLDRFLREWDQLLQEVRG